MSQSLEPFSQLVEMTVHVSNLLSFVAHPEGPLRLKYTSLAPACKVASNEVITFASFYERERESG